MTRNVLLVDDEPAFIGLWAQILHRIRGFRICTAENGLDALNAIYNEGFKPDLVITGIMMPVMNGFEMIEFIRRRDADVPIIVYTGPCGLLKCLPLRINGIVREIRLHPASVAQIRQDVRNAVA